MSGGPIFEFLLGSAMLTAGVVVPILLVRLLNAVGPKRARLLLGVLLCGTFALFIAAVIYVALDKRTWQDMKKWQDEKQAELDAAMREILGED